jgi:hypothetical protein
MMKDLYYKKKSDRSGGEIEVEKIYNDYLNLLTKHMGVKSTYDYELDQVGKALFGSLFKGVYPMDSFKLKLKPDECCILNTGLHWVAAYMNGSTLVIYDSFGRPWKELFGDRLNKYKKVVNTENDAEQPMAAETCGPRCLAWLGVVYTIGIDKAMLL